MIDTQQLLLVVTLTMAFSSMLLVALMFLRNNREERWNRERQMIELEKLRASLEGDVYRSNAKLTSTPDRWRDVNHLLIDAQERLLATGDQAQSEARLLQRAGIPAAEIDPRQVFVLTPFHDTFRDTFETIRSTCGDVGLRCVRGDEEYVPGEVFPHILRELARSRFVIANIDGRNPNVYYELGLAHGLGKSVILVSTSLEEAPFDLKSKRIILYKSQRDLRDRLKQEFTKLLVES